MHRRHQSLVAVLLMVAVTGAAWQTCVEDVSSSPAQKMACCKNGHHDSDDPMECCKTETSRPRGDALIARHVDVAPPSSLLVAWLAYPDTYQLISQAYSRPIIDGSPPGATLRPPAYIAFSALLI